MASDISKEDRALLKAFLDEHKDVSPLPADLLDDRRDKNIENTDAALVGLIQELLNGNI